MADQWYLYNFAQDREDGPFTPQRVQEMARAGWLTPDSLLRHEESPERYEVRNLAWLAPLLPLHDGIPSPGNVQFAGFWIRFGAYIIDAFVLFPISVVLELMLRGAGLPFAGEFMSMDGGSGSLQTGDALNTVLGIVVGVYYFVHFHSSERGATLGKRALGLRVVTTDFERLTPGRAFGRYCAKIVSGLTLMIGFIMAGMSVRKTALHDLICNTYVIYDPSKRR